MQRLWWNLVYWLGKTPWDTNITPPEVRAVVEGGQVRAGRALDLGCGTGTNVIYLVQHAFEAIGVDISSRAIARARRKIERAGLVGLARVYAGDVARLDQLPISGAFDLILDIGCLHGIPTSARQRYAHGVVSRLRPGGLYMLYTFGPGQSLGLSAGQVQQLFTPALSLRGATTGQDPSGPASAWYTFQNRAVA